VRLETDAVQLILEAVTQRRIDVIWSFVLDLENDQNPFEERRSGVARWKVFASEMVRDARQIQERAEEIADLGFKPLDALHLSGAITGKAAHFITVDDGILNKSNRLKQIAIISPLAFVEQFGEQL
jgi:hypothetical protein